MTKLAPFGGIPNRRELVAPICPDLLYRKLKTHLT